MKKWIFGFETTLSSNGTLRIIENARLHGYRIALVFFWLNSAETAIQRVAQRVNEGGHGLPDETIIRRYHRGLSNFNRIFKTMVNFWMIVDNSGSVFKIVAESEGAIEKIHDLGTYTKIVGGDGK